MHVGDIEYTNSGGLSIAWQRFGTPGGVPVVAVPPLATNLDLLWEWPGIVHYLERWRRFADVRHFDKRGAGLSDRSQTALTLDERMEDISAVMDAAGLGHASIFALSEGGPMAMLFAATHPERVDALVLQGTFATIRQHDDYECGVPDAFLDFFVERLVSTWATPDTIVPRLFQPSQGQPPDEDYLRFMVRWQRGSTTPATIRRLMEVNVEIDVRHIVGSIRCPTLVIHAANDMVVPAAQGAWLADHIPGARFVAYDSGDHYPALDAVEEQLAVIEEFLTGTVSAAPSERALATVVFTDIVDSTAQLAALGDVAWRAVLESHDRAIAREVERAGGRVLKSTGDGALATFGSPSSAVRCAQACTAAVASFGIRIRAGVHTGEIERRGDDIAGIAVHLGARVAALAGAGEVLVSAAVPPLVVGSGIEFDDRGEHELKGIPGTWRLFAASPAGG